MEAAEQESPIKAVAARSRPPRLRPNQHDQLRDAKLDLGAHYRIETDESLILQQFFDEQFGGWVAGKLQPGQTNVKKRGRS